MWILSLTTTVYETYHYNSTYAVPYSFCNGAGKKLYFHPRQDENRYQMDRGTQGWKDIPTYGTRWGEA